MKVYMYFLKSNPNELYAYTTDKEYKEYFESQRNMDVFYKKKETLEKNVGYVFLSKNRSKQIVKDYLNDGERDYEIYATVDESNALSESCDYIDSVARHIRHRIQLMHLKPKYLKSILALTDVIKIDNKVPTLKINTFKLFYELFKHTFFQTKNENTI